MADSHESDKDQESMAEGPGAEDSLIASASRWMNDALKAWADDDYSKVAVLAPLAVEHLGKAVLWRINPVLIAPLSQDAEHSLVSLATKPDITDPRLRTISLAVMLRRLEQLLGALPIDKKRCSRMVEIRNGAMHIGSPAQSRYVLMDSLALCRTLLEQLNCDSKAFYGAHYGNANSLLDEKRTEVGHRVAAKRARARSHLNDLEERLGLVVFEETTERLEGQAAALLNPEDFGVGLYAIDQACPECGSTGRLFGGADAESEADWDVEPTGGGQYMPVFAGVSWTVLFSPEAFACNVCRLMLNGPEELSECALPTVRYEIAPEELGYDFEAQLWESTEYDP